MLLLTDGLFVTKMMVFRTGKESSPLRQPLYPCGEGWMVLVGVSEPSQLDSLMAAEQYESFAGGIQL